MLQGDGALGPAAGDCQLSDPRLEPTALLTRQPAKPCPCFLEHFCAFSVQVLTWPLSLSLQEEPTFSD